MSEREQTGGVTDTSPFVIAAGGAAARRQRVPAEAPPTARGPCVSRCGTTSRRGQAVTRICCMPWRSWLRCRHQSTAS